MEGDFLRAARRNARAPGEKRRPLPWPIDCRSIGCSAYVSAGIAGCADSTGLVLQILRGSVIIPSLTKSVRDWYIGNTSASQAEVAGSTPVSRSKTKRTSGRMSFLFWVPPPKSATPPFGIRMLGVGKTIPVPRPGRLLLACGENACAAQKRRGPGGPLGSLSVTNLRFQNIKFNRPFHAGAKSALLND